MADFRNALPEFRDVLNSSRYDPAVHAAMATANVRARRFVSNTRKDYMLYQYDRQSLTPAEYGKTGVFRSVIASNGKILCVSPPKSLALREADGLEDNQVDQVIVEDFVDGVMINVFWDDNAIEPGVGDFMIATKTSIDANRHFFDNGGFSQPPSFRTLFERTCDAVGLSLSKHLSRNICYSFVMQHPDYRIVTKVSTPKLTLVAAYIIDQDNFTFNNVRNVIASIVVKREDGETKPISLVTWSVALEEVASGKATIYAFADTTVELPRRRTYDEWKSYYGSGSGSGSGSVRDLSQITQGLMLHYIDSKLVERRVKKRDERYEMIKMLRGNVASLAERYVELDREGSLEQYLEYYPEHGAYFKIYRTRRSRFINALCKQYNKKYTTPFKNASPELIPHLVKMHRVFNDTFVKNRMVAAYIGMQSVKDVAAIIQTNIGPAHTS